MGLDINPPEDEQKDEVLQQHQGSYQLLEADLSKEGDVKDAISTARDFFGDQVCRLEHCLQAIKLDYISSWAT